VRPLNVRFSLENVILVALSVGDFKPNFDLFLNPIVIKLKKIELGIDIQFKDLVKEIKFFLIAGVYDKPAKSAVINMISSTGFFGCTKCLQPGESFKANKDQRGQTHVYPLIRETPHGPLRTDENYSNDLNESIKLKISINGVKGSCILSALKYFKPISSTCIDYMHSLLEGVVKNFFRYWFEKGDYLGPHSLRKYMQKIDERLLLIKPPKFVPSTPRSIYTHNLWRAHEYLAFLLYYALPVFKNIMDDKYYQNLKKIVVFTEVLLSPIISMSDLKIIDKIIVDFVQELKDLYSPRIMLSGVHELLHMVTCTIEFGPLNCINCFQFEEINRKLLQFIHGYDLIGEEMIKIFSTAQFLGSYALDVTNIEIKDFILSRLRFKSSNTKKLNVKKYQIKIMDKKDRSVNENYIDTIRKYTGQIYDELITCQKLSIDGIKFSSKEIITKRNDSSFYTNNNKIGQIECFVFLNNEIFVIYRQIVSLFNPFYSNVCPEIRSNYLFVMMQINYSLKT
jgi:hypothetical protein